MSVSITQQRRSALNGEGTVDIIVVAMDGAVATVEVTWTSNEAARDVTDLAYDAIKKVVSRSTEQQRGGGTEAEWARGLPHA